MCVWEATGRPDRSIGCRNRLFALVGLNQRRVDCVEEVFAKEDLMRLIVPAFLLAAAGALWFCTAEPAQAQSGVSNRPSRVITYGRPRTRVTVQRQRSYLDPGPQLQPFSQSYTDYVFLNRRPTDALGPGQGNDRQPFPYSWEPGGNWRIP
jgi:hypothetical protein